MAKINSSENSKTVAIVLEKVKERYSSDMAECQYVGTANRMIDEEGFSFVDDDIYKNLQIVKSLIRLLTVP